MTVMNGTKIEVRGRKVMIRPVNGIVPITLYDTALAAPYGAVPYIMAVSFDDQVDRIPLPFNTWIVTRFDRWIRLYYPFGSETALDAAIEIVTADDLDEDIRPIADSDHYVYNFRYDFPTVVPPLGGIVILEVPFYYPIMPTPYRITAYRPISSLLLIADRASSWLAATVDVFTDDDPVTPIATFSQADPSPWVVTPRTTLDLAAGAIPMPNRFPIAAYWRLYRIVITNADANPITVNFVSAWGKPV